MHDQLPISYEEMRALVVEALASTPDSQSGSLEAAVAKLGSKRGHLQAAQQLPGPHYTNTHGSPSEDHLSRKDLARLQSIQWDLIIEGVIRDTARPSPPRFGRAASASPCDLER